MTAHFSSELSQTDQQHSIFLQRITVNLKRFAQHESEVMDVTLTQEYQYWFPSALLSGGSEKDVSLFRILCSKHVQFKAMLLRDSQLIILSWHDTKNVIFGSDWFRICLHDHFPPVSMWYPLAVSKYFKRSI